MWKSGLSTSTRSPVLFFGHGVEILDRVPDAGSSGSSSRRAAVLRPVALVALDLVVRVDRELVAALRAGDDLLVAVERLGHRPGGDDERLGDEQLQEQHEDDDEDDRLDDLAGRVAGWVRLLLLRLGLRASVGGSATSGMTSLGGSSVAVDRGIRSRASFDSAGQPPWQTGFERRLSIGVRLRATAFGRPCHRSDRISAATAGGTSPPSGTRAPGRRPSPGPGGAAGG